MAPSGADQGFFQTAPILPNQFYDDATYQRCFHLFLPKDIRVATEAEVASIGAEVITDEVFDWVTDSERNTPYLKGSGRDAFGRWNGELVTGEGWRQLQKFGIAKGFVAAGYDTPFERYSRPYQFLRLQLWEPSCANVTCPSAMQDGAARLLQLHLGDAKRASRLSDEQRLVFENAFSHLVSRDPAEAWTSGQWMTERSGGSDVSLTETAATLDDDTPQPLASREEGIPLGPWAINGFKWFSSATDSDMTILLARTSKTSGLSAFFAPLRRDSQSRDEALGNSKANKKSLNGVKIQRLKNKVGTRPLPTAELVLEDMRGWMIGEEGKGIREISTVLTITRVHSAIAAVGYAGRSLSIARAFARVRDVGAGKGSRTRLIDSPLHMRTLAKLTVEYRGIMMLAHYTSYILGLSEHGPQNSYRQSQALAAISPPATASHALLRILTQITKAYVCNTAVSLVFSCMEALGGVGYLNNNDQEYLNISRLWRDCAVLPIWEGTTDVLSTDFIRAVKHPSGGAEALDALNGVMASALAYQRGAQWGIKEQWDSLRKRIDETSQEILMGEARDMIWEVAQLLTAVLLCVDARSDGDAIAGHIARRYIESNTVVTASVAASSNARQKLQRDVAIVYGATDPRIMSKL